MADPTIAKMETDMTKAQQTERVAKGNGFGATFVNKLSIFRIDYVLPSKDIKVNSYRTVRENYSDHYPVCVTLTL